MKPKKVSVIVNPAAGEDEPVLAPMNRVFAQYEVEWDLHMTREFGDGTRMAREILATESPDMLLVYGGDGTICDVVCGLVGYDVPLGILTGGTGNAVADEFKVDRDLARALTQICEGDGNIQGVDVGKIGEDQYFLLRADTGLSAKVMEGTSREMKDQWGIMAYFMTVAQTLVKNTPSTEYRITVDEEQHTVEGHGCIVTNLGSLGALSFNIDRQIVYDDGVMDIYILRKDAISLLGSSLAAAADVGKVRDFLPHWVGQKIRIETDTPQGVNCDAEPTTETPVDIEVLRAAVNIFMPTRQANKG